MKTRIALVSCVKKKGPSRARARDLYRSSLFQGLRRYAEDNADTWYILSAKHHVLRPDEEVEPYEETLNKMPKACRLAWAKKVLERLLQLLPADAEIILLAGVRYREFVETFLREKGFTVSVPLEGKRIGKQLKYLKEHAPCPQ